MPSIEAISREINSGAAASPAASKASNNSASTKSSRPYDSPSASTSTSGSHSSASSAQSFDLQVRYMHQPPGSRASQTLDLLMVGGQIEEFQTSDPHILYADLNMLDSGYQFEPRAAPKDLHIWHPHGQIPRIILDGGQSKSITSSSAPESSSLADRSYYCRARQQTTQRQVIVLEAQTS